MAAVGADFVAFVRANERSLLRLAWVLMADRHAAEDLVQTALEKTLPHWTSVRDDDPVAYVHRVMVNTRTSWWRRSKGRESVVHEVVERVDATDRGERFAERSRLAAALRVLTDGQRKVVVLRHYADLSEAQVAEHVELPVGVGIGGAGLRTAEKLRLGQREGRDRPNQNAACEQQDLANHPPAFSALDGAHHGAGSIDAPSFLNSI